MTLVTIVALPMLAPLSDLTHDTVVLLGQAFGLLLLPYEPIEVDIDV
jgi:hypothetical protein